MDKETLAAASSSSGNVTATISAVRKKSTEKNLSLPHPPPDPSDLPDAFKRIIGYKDREVNFLKSLKETIQMENKKNEFRQQHSLAACSSDGGASLCDNSNNDVPETASVGAIKKTTSESDGYYTPPPMNISEECDSYILPLLKRSGPSISAALVTQGAVDQLDRLHNILEQLLNMQSQQYKLRRSTRDVETLYGLKKMQKKVRYFSFLLTCFISSCILLKIKTLADKISGFCSCLVFY